MLDIDHFKLVNDQYGHPVGDRVIQSLARLLSHRLRKGDIAARYGGEEFALILPQTDGESARGVLDELRKVFSEVHFSHDGEDFRVSFSAGIASSPPHVELLPLIEAADSALYQAKHEGRNCIMVDPA
jgi:diguanylate cyclase (GGDEF)-like protein